MCDSIEDVKLQLNRWVSRPLYALRLFEDPKEILFMQFTSISIYYIDIKAERFLKPMNAETRPASAAEVGRGHWKSSPGRLWGDKRIKGEWHLGLIMKRVDSWASWRVLRAPSIPRLLGNLKTLTEQSEWKLMKLECQIWATLWKPGWMLWKVLPQTRE